MGFRFVFLIYIFSDKEKNKKKLVYKIESHLNRYWITKSINVVGFTKTFFNDVRTQIFTLQVKDDDISKIVHSDKYLKKL